MNIYCSGNKIEKKIKKHSLRKILENGGILNGEEFEIMLKEEAEERRDSKLEEINQNIIQLNKQCMKSWKLFLIINRKGDL